jgi:hypothetical protein
MRGVGEDDEGKEEEDDDEAGGMAGEERSVDCEGRFVGPPFSELKRARGPVGGALPDIVEPKLADVVEESEYRQRYEWHRQLIDLDQPCSIQLNLLLTPVLRPQNQCPLLFLFFFIHS